MEERDGEINNIWKVGNLQITRPPVNRPHTDVRATPAAQNNIFLDIQLKIAFDFAFCLLTLN